MANAQDLPDLSTVSAELTVPSMTAGSPAPGQRVRQTTTGWEGTAVHHALYLPQDWKSGSKYPVIAEYAGNGGYKNKYGDVSEGTVQGSNLGYGLSGGKGFIWVCLPYVEEKSGVKGNATNWWGDVGETKRYALETLRHLATAYGADASNVVLAGFSRGSIGCNYIGLHDDEIAPKWRAFFCHSHYDGVREGWGYAGADRKSALARLQRLNGRPQWISHEGSVADIERYLNGTGVEIGEPGQFTLRALPFRNHSDQWVLRDIPERKAAREWLARVVGK